MADSTSTGTSWSLRLLHFLIKVFKLETPSILKSQPILLQVSQCQQLWSKLKLLAKGSARCVAKLVLIILVNSFARQELTKVKGNATSNSNGRRRTMTTRGRVLIVEMMAKVMRRDAVRDSSFNQTLGTV
jgi:hypothetical protein